MLIEIPGFKRLDLKYLILDYNGTIAKDGIVYPEIKERIEKLSESLSIYVLTADTHGTARKNCENLPLEIFTFPNDRAGDEKENIIKKLGKDNCIAIGNGYNDAKMCKLSAISVGVINEEGISSELIKNVDIVTRSITDALDLFLKKERLIASLRG